MQNQGESIYIITKHLSITVASLIEVCTLLNEAYGDVLGSFTKSSNEDFNAVFQHLCNKERINYISLCVPTVTSPFDLSSIKSTISKINII